MKHADQSNHSVNTHSFYRAVTSIVALFGTIKSGISPTQFDSKVWYDRAIRVVGGLIILLVLLAGFALLLSDHFKRGIELAGWIAHRSW
jgi:hypothetical protein